MRTDTATQPVTRATSVEPSRAWILGLVVDADGSLSAPPVADSEWPSSTQDDTTGTPDQTMSQDGPTVRP